MIKNVVSEIGGIGLYGVISICLFFAVFTGMLIWAMRMKKTVAQKMSACPLHDGELKVSQKGVSHE